MPDHMWENYGYLGDFLNNEDWDASLDLQVYGPAPAYRRRDVDAHWTYTTLPAEHLPHRLDRQEAAGFGYAGQGPRTFQRSDARIYEDVCECMTEDPNLDASNIAVKVEGGEVTLEGTVDSRRAKVLAEDIAEAAFGVKDVHNRIRIDAMRQ